MFRTIGIRGIQPDIERIGNEQQGFPGKNQKARDKKDACCEKHVTNNFCISQSIGARDRVDILKLIAFDILYIKYDGIDEDGQEEKRSQQEREHRVIVICDEYNKHGAKYSRRYRQVLDKQHSF